VAIIVLVSSFAIGSVADKNLVIVQPYGLNIDGPMVALLFGAGLPLGALLHHITFFLRWTIPAIAERRQEGAVDEMMGG
jgi:uncharacterized membrane protein YciS (DUF1049 family)